MSDDEGPITEVDKSTVASPLQVKQPRRRLTRTVSVGVQTMPMEKTNNAAVQTDHAHTHTSVEEEVISAVVAHTLSLQVCINNCTLQTMHQSSD